ncbi:MAG: homoserine dehydrogenase [Clostridiales bacterium]|nr:homoserine dehydrogenase [Clostridiales bacterium]
MNIAILGYGTVGSGVYELLANTRAKALKNVTVTTVFSKPSEANPSCTTQNIEEVLADDSIKVVVEALGGLHPAYEYITRALQEKKHVITANKAVVAAHLEEFMTLAHENGVRFLFEATSGGGIPWIAALEKAKRMEDVSYFYGIFNGTSNYILDAMFQQDQSFAQALAQAQALGYAEADPASDLNGQDVRNKVIISCAVAFDAYIDPTSIPCYGIENVQKQDMEYLKKQGLCIKYIGEGYQCDSHYEAFVMPAIVPSSSIKANVSTNYNAISLYGESIGLLTFYGQGAGKFPTANAILQDLIDIVENPQKSSPPFCSTLPYLAEQKNRYLIRSGINISSPFIEKEEEGYVYTKNITANELKAFVDSYQDPALFVAKFSSFKE